MVDAPEKIWATSAMTMDGQKWVDDEGAEYTRSDIAERQIAELRAELINRVNYWSELYSKEYHRAEAAEAENARLRALPLKDEVERVLEPFLPAYHAYIETMNGFTVSGETSAERRFSDGERRDTASEAAYEALTKVTFDDLVAVDTLLSRLRAGEQEGWRDNDTVKRATESAIAFWRTCKRPDLKDEDKVRGALIKYQMALDATAIASPSVSEGGSRP
jgi:hypothetical protein